MAYSIRTASSSRGRLLTTLVSALLVVCGLMATTASSASAAKFNGACEPEEFCLGYWYNLSGGMYDNTGHDLDTLPHDLSNNRFIGNGAVVGNNSYSMWNMGSTHEVLVYDGARHTGAVACLKRSRGLLNLDGSWWKDRISSYKWVTSCPRGVGVWG